MSSLEPERGPDQTSAWAERAADRSPAVQRSRTRSMARAKQIVQAARRLIAVKGTSFTTQDLVKEAGVALKTFYKHFAGKDQVLLAVLEDVVAEGCASFAEQARDLSDPLERLKLYVTAVPAGLGASPNDTGGPRFVTSEHWRLQQLYPAEVAVATKPFTDLLLPEIRAAVDAGRLRPSDAEYDAWLVAQLVMAVFHHYAFTESPDSPDVVAERVWSFCLAALGGHPSEPEPATPQRLRRRGKGRSS